MAMLGKLETGKAKLPLGIQIPLTAFLLTLVLVIVACLGFYQQTEKLILDKEQKELTSDNNLVQSLLTEPYLLTQRDLQYLRRHAAVQALSEGNSISVEQASAQLAELFQYVLESHPFYMQVGYLKLQNSPEPGRNSPELDNNSLEPSKNSLEPDNDSFESNSHGYKAFFVDRHLNDLKTQVEGSFLTSSYLSEAKMQGHSQVYFSPVHLLRQDGRVVKPHKPIVWVVQPLNRDSNGVPRDFLTVKLDFSYFLRNITTSNLIHTTLYITNPEGYFIFHPDRRKTFGFEFRKRYRLKTSFPGLNSEVINNSEAKVFKQLAAQQGAAYPAIYEKFRPLASHRQYWFGVLLRYENTNARMELRGFRNRVLIGGILVSIVVLGLAIWLSRLITQPLTQMIGAIGQGDLTTQLSHLPVKSSNEVGVLARSFYNLLVRIDQVLRAEQQSVLQGKESSDLLQAVVDSAVDGIVTIDVKGIILSFNTAAEEIFGYSQAEVLGQPVKMLMPEQYSAKHDEYIAKHLRTGENSQFGRERELQGLKKNGDTFPLNLAISAVDTQQGKIFTGLIRDITDRKRAEEALAETNEQLELVIDSIALGIWDWQVDTDELVLNERWSDMLGYSLSELVPITSETWRNFIHPDDRSISDQAMEQYWLGELDSYLCEVRMLHKQGYWVWVLDAGKVVEWYANGTPKRMIGTQLDISKSKDREQQLAEARKYIDGITNSVPVLLAYIDNHSRFQFVNKNYESWFDLSAKQVRGKHMKDVLGEETIDQVQPYVDRVLSGEMVFFDLEIPHRSAGLRYVQVTYAPDKADGEVQGFFASIEDVTRIKSTEARLKELSWRMEFALTAPGIGVWDLNLQTRELIWDKRMYRLYGLSEKQTNASYDVWEKALHPEDVATVIAEFERCLASGEDFDIEFRILWPSDEVRYIRAHAKIISDDQGNYVRMVGTNLDVTDQRAMAQEREKALEKAEESAKLKSEFLASMSHEIRTPMNGVLGMLNLLMRSELDKEQRHHASLARSSAESLLTLINDILDFSKIESGKLELEVLDFNLRDMLGELAESSALRAQEKGLEIILDLHDVRDSMVRGDSGRIRQVLTNLLGNAIKFTEQGEIIVLAHLKQSAEGGLSLTCVIQDTGIGIPPEKLANLFEAFTQVDASTTRKYGGTGLGLAIVKQLCHLMGGDISVTSELGQGSRFEFYVHLQSSEQSQPARPPTNIDAWRILLVDDNFSNRQCLATQLQDWGAQVSEAQDYASALNHLRSSVSKAKESSPFKIIFIDMQMADGKGMELLKKLKAEVDLSASQVALMTPISQRPAPSQLAELDISIYFPKPTTTQDLFNVFAAVESGGKITESADRGGAYRNVLNRSTMQCYAEDGYSENNPSNQFNWPVDSRLLLVEDNQINLEVAQGLLDGLGLSADVAGNGIEALAALRQAPESSPYHLILMDCQMPEMDGFEASRLIRAGVAGAQAQDIAIIAMTANAMKGDRERCLDAGMNDYLSKPVDPALLEDKLRRWLISNDKVDVKSSDNGEGNVMLDGHSEVLDKPVEQAPIWDQASALKRVMGKEARLVRLVRMFLDNMPASIEQLQSALGRDSLDEAEKIAHTIKGVSGNLSGMRMMEQAGNIESLCREGKQEEVQQQWPELLQQYQLLEETLESYYQTYQQQPPPDHQATAS